MIDGQGKRVGDTVLGGWMQLGSWGSPKVAKSCRAFE